MKTPINIPLARQLFSYSFGEMGEGRFVFNETHAVKLADTITNGNNPDLQNFENTVKNSITSSKFNKTSSLQQLKNKLI